MNISNLLAGMAFIVSVISLWYTVCVNRKETNRIRKQATLDAFNILQTQVLDELSQIRLQEFENIAVNRRKSEYRTEYAHIRTLLARIEHFSVGVESEIYDYKTVDKLAAEHLIRLYHRAEPVVKAAREYAEGEKPYTSFEALQKRLANEHPEIRINKKN